MVGVGEGVPGREERKGKGGAGSITVLWRCWSGSNVEGTAMSAAWWRGGSGVGGSTAWRGGHQYGVLESKL